jgi:hypothetical protein
MMVAPVTNDDSAQARNRIGSGMDGQSGLVLFGAGLAGGIVTAIVGGASLITFPALLGAGLPAVVANASGGSGSGSCRERRHPEAGTRPPAG